MNQPDKIPLFPLGVVLFPGLPLPLHIFEERYKLMIRECLDNKMIFGVVYYTGENFYKIGTTATIQQVLKRFDDGRMNILCKGQKRFMIDRISNEKQYLQGEIKYFDDEENDSPIELQELSAAAVKLFQDAVRSINKTDLPDMSALGSKEISFLISASAGFSLNERQAFLEMTSTTERLKKARAALQRMIDRNKVTKEIESIISGNGFLHNKTF